MRELFKKFITSSIIFNIILLIIGIISVINPSFTINSLGILIALFFIIAGIFLIYTDIQIRRFYLPFETVLTGIVFILFGILLFRNTDVLNVIIPIFVGVNIIVEAVYSMRLSRILKEIDNDKTWVLSYILGILEIILGFLLMINPFSSIGIITFLGIVLIVNSIFGIVDTLTLNKNAKDLVNYLKDKYKRAD